MHEIRCPDCGRKLGEMANDIACLSQGGRTVVVREIISIQCDKCRSVWVPRMPKAALFEVAPASSGPAPGDSVAAVGSMGSVGEVAAPAAGVRLGDVLSTDAVALPARKI